MLNWLIRLLGGIPAEVARNNQDEIHKLILLQHDREIDFYKAEIERLVKDNLHLRDLIFQKLGFDSGQVDTNLGRHENEAPISNSRPSWPRLRKQLEEMDYRKHQEAIEKHWREKGGVEVTQLEDNKGA